MIDSYILRIILAASGNWFAYRDDKINKIIESTASTAEGRYEQVGEALDFATSTLIRDICLHSLLSIAAMSTAYEQYKQGDFVVTIVLIAVTIFMLINVYKFAIMKIYNASQYVYIMLKIASLYTMVEEFDELADKKQLIQYFEDIGVKIKYDD